VPAREWDTIADFGFDAVWLMGVWERSPAGISIANENKNLLDDFRGALPDFRPDDNVGSPYCVRRYAVDQQLGGPEGLAIARRELSKRGMNLILDFVPNHVAPDHPWVAKNPEYFIRGTVVDSTKGWFLDEHWPHYRSILSPVAIHHGYLFNSAAPDEENINERVHWSVLAKRGSGATPLYNPTNLPGQIPPEKIAAITDQEQDLLPREDRFDVPSAHSGE